MAAHLALLAYISCSPFLLYKGSDGINVDYEGHDPSLSAGFSEAIVEACNAFHEMLPGSEVSIVAPFYPHYEGRNYNYTAIANACDYLFVMAYDGEFWDNVQCALMPAVDCAMATSSLQMNQDAVDSYLNLGVDSKKLYLGLPWYVFDVRVCV